MRYCRDLGLDIFRNKITEDSNIAKVITDGLLSLISAERTGTAAVSAGTTFSSVLSLLAALSPACYTHIFVTPYLDEASDFYKAEAERMLLIEVVDAADYLQHIQRRLDEEADRAEAAAVACSVAEAKTMTLAQSTNPLKGQILRVVESKLIADHVPDILLGLEQFVDAFSSGAPSRTENLERLYDLLSRVGKLSALRTTLQSLVEVRFFLGC